MSRGLAHRCCNLANVLVKLIHTITLANAPQLSDIVGHLLHTTSLHDEHVY